LLQTVRARAKPMGTERERHRGAQHQGADGEVHGRKQHHPVAREAPQRRELAELRKNTEQELDAE
jgi:hypothetical protein